MSHFTCLVVGNNPEQQLVPYKENNMDDCPEQYLEFFDVTDEYAEEYEKETVTRIKLESGELVEKWDDRFRVSGTYGIGSDTHKVPPHLEAVQVPVKEIWQDFEQFIVEYAGYQKDPKTQRYGHWENPNKKWDWYQLGGRWSGYFVLKNGEKADQAFKQDIDFAAMKQLKIAKAYATWSEFLKASTNPNFTSAKAWFEFGVENISIKENFIAEPFEEFARRQTGIATFAVLKEGHWYEKGKMGWFDGVSNEKNLNQWEEEFCNLIENLPGETLLSLYDCHI